MAMAKYFKAAAKQVFIVSILLMSLVTPGVAEIAKDDSIQAVKSRTNDLCELIRQQLLLEHYSKKTLDDNFSEVIFNLYIKQLDPQKRFLTKEDMTLLSQFRHQIDDEILNKKVEFPFMAEKLFTTRVHQIQKGVKDFFAKDFNFYEHDQFQTDIEKIEFANNLAELTSRWGKLLEYQIEIRLLDLLEEEKISLPVAIQPENSQDPKLTELRNKAKEKVAKSYEDYFTRLLEKKLSDYSDNYFIAFANAFDPHSVYMPPAEKEDFDIHMRGSLEGIGARLKETEAYIQVVSIMPGGAADRQGQLEVDDIILKVAESSGEAVEITGMPIRDAVGLIRGKKGSQVRLTVKKVDGTIVLISIIRDVVQIEETFVKNTAIVNPEDKSEYGYIRIPTFYRDFKKTHHGEEGRNSTDDVKEAIANLRKKDIKGIILDLRNNGGGALIDAVSIAGLFIKDGPVVQVKEANGKIQVHADEDPRIAYDGPLVVLVNRISASASEILAGALQDYNRGIIVGSDHTHGKGTVQSIIDLDSKVFFQNLRKYMPLGALKITIQKFYRVSGDSVQYRGVVPDIVLPDTMQYLDYGEKYLENSLPWDKVQPALFQQTGIVEKKLHAVQEKSKERVEKNEIFHDIAEDAKRIDEKRKQTLVSLNILDAWKERQEAQLQKKSKKWSNIEGMHSMGEGDDDNSGEKKSHKKTTPQEKNELWLKTLNEDPYVKEGVAVLHDMVN